MSRGPSYHARTHLPGGTDPLDLSGSATLADTIRGLAGIDAFWKLNEASGTTAFDSSGNGFDMECAPRSAPTWGLGAGPPGELSAGFSHTQRESRTHTGYTNNFTAFGWVYLDTIGAVSAIMGEGAPSHNTGSGWELIFDVTGAKLTLNVNSAANYLVSSSTIAATTWTMFAFKRDAGAWKLYVNGVPDQVGTLSTAPSSNTDLWLGNDNNNWALSGDFFLHGRLSYCALVNAALTDGDILNLYNTAGFGGTAGEGTVFTNPGGGGTPFWAYPVTTWINGV